MISNKLLVKVSIFALVATASFQAKAAPQAPRKLLEYVWSIGTVAPKFYKSYRCELFDDNQVKETWTEGANDTIKTKAIDWTRNIRDSRTMGELINEAAKTVVPNKPGPVGGESTTLNWVRQFEVDGKKVNEVGILEQRSGERLKNKSKAARKLIALIDNNCKR